MRGFFLPGVLVKRRLCVDGVKGSGRMNEFVVWSSSPGYGLLYLWKYSSEHGLPTKQQ